MSKAEPNGNQQLLDRAEIGAAAVGGACAGSAVGTLALDIAWHATYGAVLQTLPPGYWLLSGSVAGVVVGALIAHATLRRESPSDGAPAPTERPEQRKPRDSAGSARMKSTLQNLVPALVRWTSIALALFLLTLAGLYALLTLPYSRPRSLVLAPAFSLRDTEGRVHRLADYAGRPVVLVFLPQLRGEAAAGLLSLREAIPEFDRHGIKVFAVTGDAPSSAAGALRDTALRFPVLQDAGHQVAGEYRLQPGDTAAFVVGTRGVIMQETRQLQPQRLGEQLLTLSQCCLDANAQRKLRGMGKPVADARLPRLTDGSTETLYGDWAAPATVLLFLSAECPCSRGYDQRIRELFRDYSPSGVRFVGVNSSAGETADQITAHAREAGYSFPMLRDAGNRLADRLEAHVTPEVYVMDRERVLRYHGRIDDSREAAGVRSNDLRNALDALVAGKLPPRPEAGAFGCAIARVQNADAAGG